MKFRHGLIAALLMAAFFPLSAHAAGMFQGTPAATTVPPYGCIPSDVYGPSYSGNNQGLIPQTVCLTPGQITGQALSNPLNNYSTIPLGSVAYSSLGTDTTDVAAAVWVTDLNVPRDVTVTGLYCLQGGTATTDKIIGSIYSSSGALLANSATAGIALATANTFKQLPFVTAVALEAGTYYVGLQGNGTAAGAFRTVAASTYIGHVSAKVTGGAFGTLPAITPPTTFTADLAPICYTY